MVVVSPPPDGLASRVAFALIRTGQLDAEGAASPFTKIQKSVVDNAAARALAMEAGQQSIVLLQNEPVGAAAQGTAAKPLAARKLLPLVVKAGTKLAFLGPHADATQAMLSNYHGDNTLVDEHSPLAAARAPRRGNNADTLKYT